MGHGCGSKNNPLHPKPSVFYVILLSHRLEDMENGKRSAEEAFDGSMSPRQRLRHQEDATQDAPIVLDHRADSAQLSRLSSSTIHRLLPCYPRKQIDNDDLIASIDPPWFSVNHPPRPTRWRRGWPRLRLESWVRCLPQFFFFLVLSSRS